MITNASDFTRRKEEEPLPSESLGAILPSLELAREMAGKGKLLGTFSLAPFSPPHQVLDKERPCATCSRFTPADNNASPSSSVAREPRHSEGQEASEEREKNTVSISGYYDIIRNIDEMEMENIIIGFKIKHAIVAPSSSQQSLNPGRSTWRQLSYGLGPGTSSLGLVKTPGENPQGLGLAGSNTTATFPEAHLLAVIPDTWAQPSVTIPVNNACDPGVCAKQMWIDATKIKNELCLTFTDNGNGMTPIKLHKMLSFGFTNKTGNKNHLPIGVYGNGFKSGSMRLGKDALVFTKNGGALSVGLLSQTYLEQINAQAVIIPIVPFNQQNKNLIVTEDSVPSLEAILKYSIFNSEKELLAEFDAIFSKKGTRIIIWNIRRNKDGKPELDFETDPLDIRIPDINSEDGAGKTKKYRRPERQDQHIPESDYSLRAYCSILYLKPRIQIILCKKKVKAQLITKSLAHIEYDVYKPNFNNKRVKITFGFNCKNKEQFGIMMYNKNRLIKSYEKVGCQTKSTSRGCGVGVIGIIECNFLKPAHNKQDFEYTKEYRTKVMEEVVTFNGIDFCWILTNLEFSFLFSG
ncbi:MORC family CW-type zinc finger protein 4-like [Rhincodon typus]|uniref:MORC family CW-type zinc finger protein 4-like n=1 Tax=Rhincodon typus TaxID=259920 RepID=UPI0020309A7A|nr:MORC family CW-type zinc finger protein 4-like [Rhincodon typus]